MIMKLMTIMMMMLMMMMMMLMMMLMMMMMMLIMMIALKEMYLKWMLRTQTVTKMERVMRIIVKMRYFPGKMETFSEKLEILHVD
jgi:hypothetical protein